ncbi:KICSTOR complex protein SZT2 [Camelus dromedarius]|uniref:KICSTOR complex protein SZT2 n=1 Tax=Camelus dromedarius TaxID=9838 RepID=A0A5N4DC39_CAMDR|nr:KICSTOR complex protein SZT2 [Camelus dromedarius]
MASERPEPEVEEAGQVFLLMKKDYRISRNVRLAWFLNHLHQTVQATPQEMLLQSEEELEVLSVLPPGWQPDEPVVPRPFLLVPSTRVTFLAWQYRFVIELDLSPSTGIVDDSTGEILFDEVFHALSRCLGGLLRPFRVPGSCIDFQPEIYVTIQAYSSIIGLQSHQVLVQGCLLDPSQREAFLQQVYEQLCLFEDKVATTLQQQYDPQSQAEDQSPDSGEPPGRKVGVSMVTADLGLVSMIRQGILALQLLPSNSSAGIIVITDGVTSVPDVAVCETLLNQLRSGTVACSFVQVGGVYSYDCSFGHVPNVELMKFIAMATFGSYLSTCPEPEPGNLGLTVYHRAFLLYSFLRSGEALNPEYYCGSQHRLFNEHLVSASSNPALALRRKKHTEKEVPADLVSTVSVRLREGYSVREVTLAKGGSQLEVKLVLLWKHNMRIEYVAVAPWPLEPEGPRGTRVEVTMEGGYDILHDVSCALRQPIRSLYRTHVIRRFWNTLQSINQTDQMLAHLQSFSSVPEHFTLPDSTKSGVPLFYIPPGSTTPVLSLQHSGSDSSHAQFAAYWKPVLSMDANSWQRWLHMHRLVLILEHDTPIPKHLHTPGSNGRYSTVQCRISHSSLTSLLRDWSSFVLVEGYSYVKLLSSAPDQPPSSFYMVRIISKAPCMVLRLGFPIGTPAQARHKIVSGLQEEILRLRFPHRVQSKEPTPKVKRKGLGGSSGGNSPSKSPPTLGPQQALSDRPCLVVLHKPLDKLLIRYEKLPLDYRAPFLLTLEPPGPLPLVSGRSASSSLASLSRYLYHQRWLWSVPSGLAPALPLSAIAQLLSILTEVRLSEGFHFACSGEGIINMVLELPIQNKPPGQATAEERPTCVVQYILFPPHSTSTKDSFSTDDDNDVEVEALEGDSELNLVTEVWVEPQYGRVGPGPESWKHLQDLTYSEIPRALHPRDAACIGSMLSFEYLIQLCQSKEWSPLPLEPRVPDGSNQGGDTCVHEIPFHFDLMGLLPQCQQLQMFFLLLSREPEGGPLSEGPCPANDMVLCLLHSCLGQELSDREIPLPAADQAAFLREGVSVWVLASPVLTLEPCLSCWPCSLPPVSTHIVGPEGPPVVDHGILQDQAGSSAQATGDSALPTLSLGPPETLKPVSSAQPPQWRCYARLVTPQHVFLTFLPATFSDVQHLAAYGLEGPSQEETKPKLGDWTGAPNLKDLGGTGVRATKSQVPILSVTPASDSALNLGELSPPFRRDFQAYTGRQTSQTESADGPRPRCPVYIYSCALEALREQMVGIQPPQAPRDLVFRTQFLDQPSQSSAWMEPRHKEAANHCALLQEHAQRCYVRGLFQSLQQAQSVTSQDLLIAVDACEELLQEVDITPFLLALCGHTRGLPHAPPSPGPLSPGLFSSSIEEGPEPRERAVLASESRLGWLLNDEKFLEISGLHFRTVPSNPHYFFYCPPSSRREDEGPRDTIDRKVSDLEFSEAELMGEEGDTSACCVVTESDPELEVEYRESREPDLGPAGLDSTSLSDADTVNPDEDSFSILGGDSPTGPENLVHDLPPLFLHLTCSVRLRGQHSSVPVCSLPTCLGQVLSSLEGPPIGGRVPLRDLSVTLDVFVLTLPLEVELPPTSDPQHHRSTSESSASFPRSPGQPSDDGLGPPLPPPGEDRHPGLSNLAIPHRLAIETTMSEIRWLLEDEMVGALRRGGIPQSPALHRAAAHIHSSPGRSTCFRQTLPLSFVFGPERSLTQFKEEFRRLHLPGHVLLEDPDSSFFFVAAGQQPGGSHGEPPSAAWAWHSHEERAEGVEGEALTASPQAPGSPEDAEGPLLISLPSLPQGGSQPGPSQGLSLISSQGSVDSDHLGYDGDSSGSDSEGPNETPGEKAAFTLRTPPGLAPPQPSLAGLPGPCLPDFWLIVRVLQDRVEVYAHARSLIREDGGPGTECRHLQQLLVRRVGEICREVNQASLQPLITPHRHQQCKEIFQFPEILLLVSQRLLLQDLHDSHVCNSLLVAESEEDLWRSETPFHSRQRVPLPTDDYAADESCGPRGYLAATMQFVPGHFSCDVVWGTVIRVHSRLKMGPSMGVSRAIQALRSVLNAFSVVNRKNMFVYQERATKAVYYLRLLETSCSERPWDSDALPPSLALSRSQEPIYSEEASACPEITDELVRVLRRRLDEATLDVITVMLVRNCKLTPADVEVSSLPGPVFLCGSTAVHPAPWKSPLRGAASGAPPSCRPWLPALAWYLRQNMLIFLHSPKYTDSNSRNHFQHPLPPQGGLPDLDIYLYNKPGGQGTGGKGVACITLAFVDEGGAPISLASWPPSSPGPPDPPQEEEFEPLTQVTRCPVVPDSSSAQNGAPRLRLDVWEKGNISIVQLEEKLRAAARQALADGIMELRLLPAPLCTEDTSPGSLRSGSLETKSPAGRASTFPPGPGPGPVPGEPVTPPSKAGRRSFWDMLPLLIQCIAPQSKTECGDLGSPKTTDDIVLDRPEDTRGRRRHKTESVRTPGGTERASGPESGTQRQRRRTTQLEEGEVGALQHVFACVAQRWMEFMVQIGCASVSRSSTHMVSRFLLPSVLSEFTTMVTSMAGDTSVRIFEQHLASEPELFSPCSLGQLGPTPNPAAERHLLLLGRNFLQWRRPTQQAAKAVQRFEPGGDGSLGRSAPRQRFLLLEVVDKKLQLLTYNWAPDLGAALGRALVRLVQWQNARAHLIFCLLSQKLGLFHHYGQLDFPVRDEKEPNPFLLPTMEAETLIRSASPPLSREQGRLSGSSRGGGPLPLDTFPFDEALRDITAARPSSSLGPVPRPPDPVTYHGQQFLEIKMAERRELERQMKMENLFVTWQQRSAPASMPISAGELETLKQSSRLVHYCATALLFDPAAWLHGPPETSGPPEGQRRHRPESGSGSREAPASCDSLDGPLPGVREEPWLKELSLVFLQQYMQYLQSMGFVLVPLRPPSPTRSLHPTGLPHPVVPFLFCSTSRLRAMAILGTEGRGSFSCPKTKTDGSPKSTGSPVTTYHLQRALPGGIILMELTFQGCYFCVKQFALECSRIPMGQAVNSQLSMLFTEECDRVRDLMHVHSFSYDFHLRLVHQHVLGAHLVLRHGYHLTTFLRHFLAHHPDGPHFGRNHIYQGTLELPTPLIAAHQLYNYVADHASSYHMKPLRMARPGGPEHNEYALVSAWHSSGSYLDSEGLRHQDDFDVSLLVCHCAAPFEEQGEAERHVLRLQFFVVLTSQRELFPRLTADMRRLRKPPRLPPEPEAPGSSVDSPGEDSGVGLAPGPAPLFPPLAAEVGVARARLAQLVRLAGGHCRRDTLWKRLFLLEPPGPDRLRLGGRLALAELEELLEAVHTKSIGDIDPQLDCFLSMTVSWYQSLIKVLLSRFPQSCRHFQSPDLGTQYLVVLNQKFTDCFVLVFLDSQLEKTSLTVVFREPFPVQPQDSESPPAQLVSTYHHLESVINTACFTLWTRLL